MNTFGVLAFCGVGNHIDLTGFFFFFLQNDNYQFKTCLVFEKIKGQQLQCISTV